VIKVIHSLISVIDVLIDRKGKGKNLHEGNASKKQTKPPKIVSLLELKTKAVC
jgi:hypothetical protein